MIILFWLVISIVVDCLSIRHVFVSSCGQLWLAVALLVWFHSWCGSFRTSSILFSGREWTRSSLTRPDQRQSGPDHEIVSAPSFSPTSYNRQTTVIELRGLVLWLWLWRRGVVQRGGRCRLRAASDPQWVSKRSVRVRSAKQLHDFLGRKARVDCSDLWNREIQPTVCKPWEAGLQQGV